MASILKFMAGNKPDASVGIFPFQEEVTIIFHNRNDYEIDSEEKEEIRKLLAELYDGYCLDYDEWLKKESKLLAEEIKLEEILKKISS